MAYITSSGFYNKTAAGLEFYFRFRFSPFRRHLHVLLHLPTKFLPNRYTVYSKVRKCDYWQPFWLFLWERKGHI